MKITQALLTAAIMLTVTGTPHAALVPSLGGQVVNDTDLNVTWLANANLAATNTFGLATGVNLGTDSYGYQSIINSDGTMTWGGAQKWIAAMNAANYLGFNDWRLPTTGPVNGSTFNYNVSYNGSTDWGFNVSAPGTAYAGSTGSEMAHLYYNSLSNKGYFNTAGIPQVGFGLVNVGSFTNFQSLVYWSGTVWAPNPEYAWYFSTNVGGQNLYYKSNNNNFYALAVRSGQVATVPVPAAVWLFGSGLISLAGVARKRKAA